jgi:MFS family permease
MSHAGVLPAGPRPGTARAALAHRDFRLVWLGAFASNLGTWIQNVSLPAYIDARTGSGAMVGLLVFAQLGPVLLLAIPAGILADKLPRRGWLVTLQLVQIVFSLVLAAMVAADSPVWALMVANAGVGSAFALTAPVLQASMPMLVGRDDLAGAVSLNSTMMNGSRVIGPVIAGVLATWGVSAAQLLVVNAATYLFMVAALLAVHIPTVVGDHPERGWRQVLTGVRIARERPIIGRLLVSMALFSLFCLPYVGLFPTVTRLNFGIDPTSNTYQWLYATWGLGACLGALSIGTVFARVDKRRLVPVGFLGFAVSLTAFALIRSPGLAFVAGFVLGAFYFGTATSMVTVVQATVNDNERARVMALWFMAFGGTVPIGNLLFGPVIDAIGARWVLLGGAVFALVLAWWTDLPRLTRASGSSGEEPGGEVLERGDAASFDEHGVAAGE